MRNADRIAGDSCGMHDLGECLARRAAKVQRGVVQTRVKLAQLGAYIKDNVRDVKGNVSNQQRGPAEDAALQAADTEALLHMTKSSISETPVMISGLTTGT